MKNWNGFKTAAVILGVWLMVLAAYGLYDGTTASSLDETRPPDSGESAQYGAAAIREIKRAFKNWLAVEHYLSGAHKTNFFQAYMAGTNSINGSSILTNSLNGNRLMAGTVPQSALAAQTGSNVMYLVYYAEHTTNVVVTGANSTFTINNTVPVITKGKELFSATLYPRASNSSFLVSSVLFGDSYGYNGIAACFTNGVTNAAAAIVWTCNVGGSGTLLKRFTVSNTNALTIAIRVGANSGTLNINGTGNAAQVFSNSAVTSLSIYEIVP